MCGVFDDRGAGQTGGFPRTQGTKAYVAADTNSFKRWSTGVIEKDTLPPVIYLDNNATTAVDPQVLEAMLPFLQSNYGNPSSIHRFGGMVRRHIDRAREQVAALIDADPGEIFFTGCGTESDNTALKGFAAVRGRAARFVTSQVEHPAVLNCCTFFEEQGHGVSRIGVDADGVLDMKALESVPLNPDTLLSFMWANNETGVVFPIAELAEHAHAHGASFHTDAVQAVGKLPISMRQIPVDFLALSGHKLHAPKGVGALFVRKGSKLPPLLHGGHQEEGLRAGTENVAGIVALGKACELAAQHRVEENARERALRDRLETTLVASCKGAKINGGKAERLPNTLNISFEFIEGEAILLLLDEHGIAASSGSACTTGSLEPSHVMRAMGVPYTLAHSSTRFSLSRYSTDSDIDAVISVLPGIIENLRSISPFVTEDRQA